MADNCLMSDVNGGRIVPKSRDLQFVADSTPQWRLRPTIPGIYVCGPMRDTAGKLLDVNPFELNGGMSALRLDAKSIADGVPFRTDYVYGPISEPKPAT